MKTASALVCDVTKLSNYVACNIFSFQIRKSYMMQKEFNTCNRWMWTFLYRSVNYEGLDLISMFRETSLTFEIVQN